jgi:hypothetical protein
MTLSDEQIENFQTLYKIRFDKEISQEDAREQGMRLVNLMRLIYQPMTVADYRKLQKRRRELKKSALKARR